MKREIEYRNDLEDYPKYRVNDAIEKHFFDAWNLYKPSFFVIPKVELTEECNGGYKKIDTRSCVSKKAVFVQGFYS